MGNGVWVYVDHFKGEALSASWEVMGVARTLANQLDTHVTALVFGHKVTGL